MSIKLISTDKMSKGKGGARFKGEKYGRYSIAVRPIVPWIKKAISESKDGKIRVKAIDFAKKLGPDFTRSSYNTLYWALKYILFKESIVVESGTLKDGIQMLIMRMVTESDRLPRSLKNY